MSLFEINAQAFYKGWMKNQHGRRPNDFATIYYYYFVLDAVYRIL